MLVITLGTFQQDYNALMKWHGGKKCQPSRTLTIVRALTSPFSAHTHCWRAPLQLVMKSKSLLPVLTLHASLYLVIPVYMLRLRYSRTALTLTTMAAHILRDQPAKVAHRVRYIPHKLNRCVCVSLNREVKFFVSTPLFIGKLWHFIAHTHSACTIRNNGRFQMNCNNCMAAKHLNAQAFDGGNVAVMQKKSNDSENATNKMLWSPHLRRSLSAHSKNCLYVQWLFGGLMHSCVRCRMNRPGHNTRRFWMLVKWYDFDSAKGLDDIWNCISKRARAPCATVSHRISAFATQPYELILCMSVIRVGRASAGCHRICRSIRIACTRIAFSCSGSVCLASCAPFSKQVSLCRV